MATQRGDAKYKNKQIGDTVGMPVGSKHSATLVELPNKSNPRNMGPDNTNGRAGEVGTANMDKRKTGKVS